MYIPSLQKNIAFNTFTIEQYNLIFKKHLLYKRLNLGFNIAFINIIKSNIEPNITLTTFDKFIIGLQIYTNDIKEKEIDFSTLKIEHPAPKTIIDNLYTFKLNIPTIDYEQNICKYIIDNNITNINTLLICEIAKYITNLQLDNIDLNLPTEVFSKIKILENVLPSSLVLCMEYIDNIKLKLKQLYSEITNNPNLKYDISLLVP